MKYTFLLPAYKSQFLEEAIESIYNQSYKDWQLIVSDDGSPEDIKSIVAQFPDKRIVYRRNEQNIGSKSLVAHWNLLLNLCETEYCILASDDDVYEPNFMEEIDALTKKYPEVDLIHARAQCIDADGKVFKTDALYEEQVNQLDFLEQLDFYNHIECVANNVYRTQRLKDIGGFVEFPLAWNSDTAICNLMARNGVVNTRDVLFSFRMSGLNISSQIVINRAVTRQKFRACCLYDDFMEKLFPQITYEETLKNRTTFERVVKQHRHRMAGLMAWQCVSLSPREFFCYLKRYRKKGYIDSLFIIVKKWLVAQVCR